MIHRFCFSTMLCFLPLTPLSAASISDPFGMLSELPVKPVKSACSTSQQGSELELLEAINIALCNNPQLRASWATAQSSAAGLGEAYSSYLPTITGGVNGERRYTDTERQSENTNIRARSGDYTRYGPELTLSYLLFDFGGREANVAMAKQAMLEAGWNYNAAMQNLVFQVVKSYMNVFTMKESLEAAVKAENASKEAFDAAQARLEVGLVTAADTAQAETAYAQSKLARQQAENDLQLAKGNFAALLRWPVSEEFRLAAVDPDALSKPIDNDVESLIQQALRRRPDLAAARAREKRAEAEKNYAWRRHLPSLSLNGSLAENRYTGDNSDTEQDGMIGINLSIPLFNGFGATYKTTAARHAQEAAAAARNEQEMNTALDVWSSYHNYQTSQLTYATAQTLLKSAEASEALALGRYKEGKGTLLDALDAQAKLADARRQWVSARYNVIITRFDLYRALGDKDVLTAL